MKKFIAILSTAACVLSLCMFTACGSENNDETSNNESDVADTSNDSDVVTIREWTSAMTTAKFLNVTADVEISDTDTYVDGETESAEFYATVKTDLVANGNYITGNTYAETNYCDSSAESCVIYESFTENSYTYVEKQTETGENDIWYGSKHDVAGTTDNSANFIDIYGIATAFIDEFANFEYVDGAYVYSEYDEILYDGYSNYDSLSNKYYIKFSDGYITSIIVEEDDYSYINGVAYGESIREEITFYNYGTTSITIPENFTYDYYIKNYT